jgi:hypothetical protein
MDTYANRPYLQKIDKGGLFISLLTRLFILSDADLRPQNL